MIVKPSVSWLNKDTDAELINNTNVVLLAMDNNVAIYTTPSPPLVDIQAALGNFTNGVAEAKDGGPSATSRKNNLRLILVGLLRQLASYVQVACKGDMTNLLLSGFPVQKPVRTPIGVLPAPGNITLTLGKRSGELQAAVNPVFGASIYNWKLTPATPGATVQTAQTTASAHVFTGLTPGETYTVMANVVGAAGPSDWSNGATQMAV